MLTYAFDLLTLIYEEEGYAPTEIPALILRHNLHGLEICPRAAQLAELALVFKAREKDRSFFRKLGVRDQGSGVSQMQRPHIIELRNVRFEENELRDYWDALKLKAVFTAPSPLTPDHSLFHQFEEAKNFGALIQPCLSESEIQSARRTLTDLCSLTPDPLSGQLFLRETHLKVLRVLEQAEALTQRYHIVVANPPYMGAKQMDAPLLSFCENNYPLGFADLFSCFIERAETLTTTGGISGLITMQGWLFQPSFVDLRRRVFAERRMSKCLHLGAAAFDTIGGEVVKTVAFTLNTGVLSNTCMFFDLTIPRGESRKEQVFLSSLASDRPPPIQAALDTRLFLRIPGAPAFYKNSEAMVEVFETSPSLGSLSALKAGLTTGDNVAFQRLWHEVSTDNIFYGCSSLEESGNRPERWYPCSSGGEFRKWYRKSSEVVDWQRNGERIRNFTNEAGKLKSRPQNTQYYFRRGFTWNKLSTSNFAVRLQECGWIYDDTSRCGYPNSEQDFDRLFAFLCSSVSPFFLGLLNPSMSFTSGDLGRLPIIDLGDLEYVTDEAVSIARADWDNFETSWDFRDFPLLRDGKSGVREQGTGGRESNPPRADEITDPSPLTPDPSCLKAATLAESWANYAAYCTAAIRRMQELETENNRLFIAAYGLDGELEPAVPEAQITLARAEARRDMAAFLSYAVGVMFGRYSLDVPGLVLADAGGTLDDYWRIVRTRNYELGIMNDEGKPAATADPDFIIHNSSFIPDQDGIIPVLDGEWFEDDIVARTRDFLRATFGEATLRENLRFLEESLGKDLRKYFLNDFYKDHLQTYKKRPIYWLASSPKGSFQALFYLHRYTRDTVNTLLNGYLREYLHKLEARLNQIAHTEATSTNAREKTAARKEADKLRKALKECQDWEREVVLPLAQQRIDLDLDDGVKANYQKFPGLLAKIPGLETKESE